MSLYLFLYIICVLTNNTFTLDTSDAKSATASMVTGGSFDYEVDLGDCVTGTLYTSITHLNMQPVSGHLVLSSAASTYARSFTLRSDFVPSIRPQITNCSMSMTSKFL